MALDESVFADYAAAQGDFNGGYANPIGVPVQQQSFAPPQVQAAPQQAQAGQGQAPQLGQDPISQFFIKWKDASPAKRKQAEGKLFADRGPVESVVGEDPTKDSVVEAWMQKKALADQKDGKPQKDKPPENRWGKFMKYVDENPQYLLEFAAKLFAPRDANVSGVSNALNAGVSALQAQQARKAASTKAALEGAKTKAETEKLTADASESPSQIKLNISKAYKNYQDAKGGTKAAASVQLLEQITNSLWATGGPKGTGEYASVDEATLAGQRMISGRASPEEQAAYDQLVASTETISVGQAEASSNAQAIADRFSPGGKRKATEALAQQQAQNLAQTQAFVAKHGGDVESMAQQFVKDRKVSLTEGRKTARKVLAAAGGKVPAPAKAAPRTLTGDLKTLDAASGSKVDDKKAAVAIKKKMKKWDNAMPPISGLASARDKRQAKITMKEIEKDYDGLSDANKDKALKIYNKLKNL